MDNEWIEWEGIARAALERTGVDAPVNALELAAEDGEVLLLPTSSQTGANGASLQRLPDGQWLIRYDPTLREVRMHGNVAHEYGHVILTRAGCDSERGARYVAGALLAPRSALDRDLRRGWALPTLMELHPNASAEILARRICELRDAEALIVDQGKLRAWHRSPWLEPAPNRITKAYRALVDDVLESERHTERDGTDAWPLFDGVFRRVVLVRNLA